MPTTCGFPNCKFRSRYRGQEDNRHFYRIPKRPPQLRLRWLDAIGRSEETVVSQLRICSAHFVGGEKHEGDIPVADPQVDPPVFIALPGRGTAARTQRRNSTAAAKRTKSLLNRSSRYLVGNRGAALAAAANYHSSLLNSAAAAAAVSSRARAARNVDYTNNSRLMMRAGGGGRGGVADEDEGEEEGQQQRYSHNSDSEDFVPTAGGAVEQLKNGASHIFPCYSPLQQYSTRFTGANSSTGVLQLPAADFTPLFTSLFSTMSKNPTPSLAPRPLVALLDGRDCSIEMPLLKEVATVAFCDAQSTSEIHEKVLNEAVAALLYHSICLNREDLLKFKALKMVVRIGSVPDNVDVQAATELGIAVCGTPAECIEETADTTMALILSLYRKVPWVVQEYSKASASAKQITGMEQVKELVSGATRIKGSVLGLVGLGRVGTAVACRAKAFGFRVLFYDPYVPSGMERSLGIERSEKLGELLGKADCLSLHCPLSPDTHSMIGVESVAKMKFGSYLVNTSAAELVSKSALLAALKSGQIRRAALDIHERRAGRGEGVPIETFAQMPNVIVMPHCSWYSDESYKEARTAAAKEIRRALSGRIPDSLQFCVNKEALGVRNSPGNSLMSLKQNGLSANVSASTSTKLGNLFQPPTLPSGPQVVSSTAGGGLHPMLQPASMATSDPMLGNFAALAAASGVSTGAMSGLAGAASETNNALGGVLGVNYPFLMSLTNPQLFGQALTPFGSSHASSNHSSTFTPSSSTHSAEFPLPNATATANTALPAILGAKSNSIVDRLAARQQERNAAEKSGALVVKGEEKIASAPSTPKATQSEERRGAKSADNHENRERVDARGNGEATTTTPDGNGAHSSANSSGVKRRHEDEEDEDEEFDD